jgi:hypothetical protein
MKYTTDDDLKEKEKIIAAIEGISPSVDGESIYFDVKDGYTFEYIKKAGQMGWIDWIRVNKNKEICAEIIESNCNITFNVELAK